MVQVIIITEDAETGETFICEMVVPIELVIRTLILDGVL